jgi:hypothetical protein
MSNVGGEIARAPPYKSVRFIITGIEHANKIRGVGA